MVVYSRVYVFRFVDGFWVQGVGQKDPRPIGMQPHRRSKRKTSAPML